MRKYLSLALVAAGVLFGPSAARADVIIDSFDDNPSPATFFQLGNGNTSAPAAANPQPGTGVIPIIGERFYTFANFANAGGGATNQGVRVDTGPATLNMGQDPDYRATLEIEYDYFGNLLDLSSLTQFELKGRVDLAPTAGSITVIDDGGNQHTASFIVPVSATLQQIIVPFAPFQAAGVNMGKIETIFLRINTVPITDVDVIIDNFQATGFIPEPTSVILLGGAILGLGCARTVRRRFARK